MGRGGKEAQAHMHVYIYTRACVLMADSLYGRNQHNILKQLSSKKKKKTNKKIMPNGYIDIPSKISS